MLGHCSSALAFLMLAGCVTSTSQEEFPLGAPLPEQVALVIPTGGDSAIGEVSPVRQYYLSIFEQMQEALGDRDLPRLRGLLRAHDGKQAPSWAVEGIDRFFTASLGLEFEAHAAAHSGIEVSGDVGPIGAPVRYEFRLDLPPDRDVVLDHPEIEGLNFLATLEVKDHDAYGGLTSHRASRILQLLARETRHAPLRTEALFAATFDEANAVVRELRATVELLPGTVLIDGRAAPVQRAELVESELFLYPDGVTAIQDDPLRTLRNAIALGDVEHHPHQYLAARFMPESDRAEAMEMLIERVRLGDPGQARVAMAALAVMTSVDLPVGDRDGWLAWWKGRQAPHLSR